VGGNVIHNSMLRAKQGKYKLLQDQKKTVYFKKTYTHLRGICYKRKAVSFKVGTFSFQSESLTRTFHCCRSLWLPSFE